MQDRWEELARRVPNYVHRGQFTLTHGSEVDWYVDGRELLMSPWESKAAGKLLSRLVRLDVDCLVVPATAGLLVLQAMIHQSKRDLYGAYVRSSTKEYGLQNQIEGRPVNRVAVVDDTCSTGGSILDTIDVLKNKGIEVIQVITLFDRDEGYKRIPYNYRRVFRLEDGVVVNSFNDYAYNVEPDI